MKKSILISILALLATSFGLNAYAEAVNWIFDSAKYGTADSVKWSETFGTAGEAGSGYWYYMDGDGVTKHYIEGGSIAATDSLTVGDSAMAKNIRLIVDAADTTVKDLTIGGGKGVNIVGSSNTNKFTVTGSMTQTNTSDNTGIGKLDLNVGTFYPEGSNFYSLDNYQVIIDSALQPSKDKNRRLNLSANGSVVDREKAGTNTFANGLANPDVYVKYTTCEGVFLGQINGQTTDLYYAFGGLKGTCGITNLPQNNPATSYVTNIILKNTNVGEAYTAVYGIREYNGGPNNNIGSIQKIRVVMNGLDGAIQQFDCPSWSDCQMLTSGGMTIISGTLRVKFNQKVSSYSYKSWDNKKRIYYSTKGDGTGVNTTFSHGDLVMQGGEFGSTTTDDAFGSFRFTNLKYSGGKITLRMKGANQMDSIDLTSYYQATAEIITQRVPGNPNATPPVADVPEVVGESTYVKVDGGTVIREAGAGKVTFNFTASLNWLIDYQADGKLGVKIISWDAIPTSLTGADFAANSFSASEKDYQAQFNLYDDGLYVRYVEAVPEPATLAAVFGAFALAFAAYRRKK